jgi:hypothetical protein
MGTQRRGGGGGAEGGLGEGERGEPPKGGTTERGRGGLHDRRRRLTPLPTLRAEVGGAGGVEEVVAVPRLHWRTVMFSVFPPTQLLLHSRS